MTREADGTTNRWFASRASSSCSSRFMALCAALLVVMATFALWSDAEVRQVLLTGLVPGLLALAVLVAASRSFFFSAARSRHPWRRRVLAVVEMLFAVYMIVLALRGP